MANETKHVPVGRSDDPRRKPVEPTQLFDDYYYVGNGIVGFHILKTSAGLVLFDAMETVDADEEYLIPGLKKLGLDQEKILMLFLTHGHLDHYMGAEHVRVRTGCDTALTKEDTAYLAWCDENMGPDVDDPILPRITRLVKDGDELTFGDHTVYVMEAPGHTPGCLNYSFEVHENGVPHRVIMVGGFGQFGPGRYPNKPYPYSVQWAVDQALVFAGSMEKTWEYVKENKVDVYFNPHPHLCPIIDVLKNPRKEGEPNALIIGVEGVRKFVLNRFDACLEAARAFADITKEYEG